MNTPILTLFLVALAVAGCQSVPVRPQAKDADTSGESKVPVLEQDIGQLRDPDTGAPFHMICDAPCSKPTVKTRYRSRVSAIGAVESPMAADPPVPVVVQTPPPERSVPPPPTVARPQVTKHFVSFAIAQSGLSHEERADLIAFLDAARASSWAVHVRGRTDITGTVTGNRRLAQARAARIQDVLIKGGVTADRITTSHCIDCFSATNETEEGRAENRRAIILLAPTREALAAVDLECRGPCRAGGVH